MGPLRSCEVCGGFVPRRLEGCPLCGAAPPRGGRAARALATLVGGSAMVVTLSACYGPPCAGGRCEPVHVPDLCADDAADTDRDGYCREYDCDESDPDRYSGALDPAGDGVDQDCDGVDGSATSGGSDGGGDSG